MSRSGYSDETDNMWQYICHRGAVASGIRGKRGQALLRRTLVALDAMPEKILIENEFGANGQFCTLGAVAAHESISLDSVDEEDTTKIARTFEVSESLVREIMYMNDEGACFLSSDPSKRWRSMRAWVAENLNSGMPHP